ncbi:MAG: hypothetical protein A2W05_03780 [Candidatus Schekmanbacteria bacterium RBG_16_38_10]|uniref:DUF3368 domain-containing protein n=1 Tax=Candidatus Schekmanbacteria bacterium RBG_16_38_10 TaxID=1817879 RepID=A0A1F7S1F9_9BACT|nr:MAG: hypothetical protein A2W05_03780 [Candidatus Schekmanbacteria bacterium RBG_16_38_10]
MTVVADSSPLISFARAKKLHIIRNVYEEIIIPPQVYNEIVVKGKRKPGAEEIQKASWIRIQKPKNQFEVEKLKARFDPGESEAMILAVELKAVLLADEGVVIKEARKRGLEITSTLLILEEAKNKHLIKSVKEELDNLISNGFRATAELIRNTLQKVGE